MVVREEVFGPVCAMMRADSAESALAIANDTEYGLSAAVFTEDLVQATRFAEQLRAGLVRVNASTSGLEPHAPFGGVKASGFGPPEQGLVSRDFFTESRTVMLR